VSAVLRRGPWRRIGDYIGRDVVLAGGRRTTELQHRLVAEQKIGRALKPGEEAHHKNEVKTDNHPDNIEVLTKAEHTRRHFGTGRTMVTLTCRGCGSAFERDVRRRHAKYCRRSCAARAAGESSGRARVTELLELEAKRLVGE
jgi:hypothetical protein